MPTTASCCQPDTQSCSHTSWKSLPTHPAALRKASVCSTTFWPWEISPNWLRKAAFTEDGGRGGRVRVGVEDGVRGHFLSLRVKARTEVTLGPAPTVSKCSIPVPRSSAEHFENKGSPTRGPSQPLANCFYSAESWPSANL